MRISDVKNISKPGAIKKKTSVNEGGDFDAMLDKTSDAQATPVNAPTGGTLLNNVSVLAANQAAREQAKEEYIQHGSSLLDEMEQLRLSLLTGKLSPQHVKRMTESIIKDKESDLNDPDLKAIIDAIELRCAVELAKLEQLKTTS